MKITFKLLVPEEDICDRCIYLIKDEYVDKWGITHDIRCVNAERIRASARNNKYWDENNCCKFYSPIGGIKKL